MKIRDLKIFGVVLVLLLAPLAFGFTVTEITTAGPTTSVTTGTSVTIPVTLKSDSSGSVSQISLVGTGRTSGSSLTILDPSAGSFSTTSVTSSGTTVNFVVSAGVADTYDYAVTSTYTGGSTSSSAAALQVVAPSSLAVSGSVNSTSHLVGTVFKVSVTISNPSASNVTTSYALTFASPSSFSVVSGDSTSGSMTLEPLGSLTFNYNVQAAAAVSNSNVRFGLGSTVDAFSQAVTNTAQPTTSTGPNSVTSGTTPTPTVSATPSPTVTVLPLVTPPAPKETTGQDEPVVASKSKEIGLSTAVTGSFAQNSATFEVAYNNGESAFNGKLTYELPFECAQKDAITILPTPTEVTCGSLIASWDLELAPKETFVVKIEVAKAVSQDVMQQFKAPTLAPKSESSARPPVEATQPPASSEQQSSAQQAPASSGNTLLYVVGALVVLGLLYYFTAMRKK